jgi:hypothetical protein
MTFHECVRMLEWEKERALLFYPPDGEFTVLNYRISDDFRIPFTISPFVEQMAPDRLDLIIKVLTHSTLQLCAFKRLIRPGSSCDSTYPKIATRTTWSLDVPYPKPS